MLRVLGPDHPDLAKIVCAEAGALVRLDRNDEAIERFDEALRQYALSEQPSTPDEQRCAAERAAIARR